MSSISLIKGLCASIDRGEPISLALAASGEVKVISSGMLGRLWHRRDSVYHKERFVPLAVLFTKLLEKQKRLSLPEADKNPYIRSARNLHRTIKDYQLADPHFAQLRKEIVAAKLGIASKVFDCNPQFQAFVEEHHLERYILEYKDEVKVDPHTQEISIRFEGQYTPWKRVQSQIQGWSKFTTQPQQTWVYGSEGIIHKNLYDWTELTPFRRGNPADWNHQYIFEFCTCYNPATLKNGNHAWLRLKTPKGDIYSVGLYRPGKSGPMDNLTLPLRIKPGYLMQPDFSEFWDYEILTIPIAITEDDFLAMKKAIEQDKKNDDMVFQLFNNNCGLYCKKIAEIGKINLPTTERIIELITPLKIQYCAKRALSYLPRCLVRVLDVVQSLFFNLISVALGSTLIDKNLDDKRRIKAQAHIQSFWDLFNPHKASLNHPLTIAFKTKPLVDSWRTKKREKLLVSSLSQGEIAKKLPQIAFGLPKKFRVT